MSVSTDPRIGTELLGYRIESVLGRGGMGVVYKAYDSRLKRYVALKFVAPELFEDERFRERFLRESELAASLEHPNVIPIYDAREVDGLLVIAMRLVEGTDLKALIRKHRGLAPAHAFALLTQLADALDTAHARGLVHRDVKPSNALLDSADHLYLADFGLAQSAADRGDLTGQIVGSVDYVAPEQIEGGEVDGRADLYSLGCLFYECLTGEVPFARDSELAVLWAHLQERPPRASERNPELRSGDRFRAREGDGEVAPEALRDVYRVCRGDKGGPRPARGSRPRPEAAIPRVRRRAYGHRGGDRSRPAQPE